MKTPADARLYAILDTGYLEPDDFERMAEAVVEGGAGLVQVRAKHESPEEIAALAARVHRITKAAGVPLVVNDHPEIAYHIQCEGAHVGQDDLTVAETRTLLGSRLKAVGKSTHSVAQAVAAQAEGPDYLGFGPVFATPTKPDYVPIGLDDIRAVHERVTLPVFCIGGIKRENARRVLEAGARRLVVVSGILQAPDPRQYCRDLCALMDEYPLSPG